jgi:hypothetical protein
MRRNIGTVYRIDYAPGKHVYGMRLEEYGLQVFQPEDINDDISKIHTSKAHFTVGLFRSNFRDPRMQRVGKHTFKPDEDTWPPTTYMYDPIHKRYSLYYRGEITPSTEKACKGLEPAAGWELDHLVDRLTGERDWLAAMKQLEEK